MVDRRVQLLTRLKRLALLKFFNMCLDKFNLPVSRVQHLISLVWLEEILIWCEERRRSEGEALRSPF